MRFPRFTCLFICVLTNTILLFAQSPNGNISGLVSDSSNAAVVGADIVAVNDLTRVQYTTKTNNDGVYILPNLPPGPYRIQVSKVAFKTIIKPDIVLNVQDALSINFTLPVGAALEVVTVRAGAPVANTESGSVSTVIDRDFVENLPLNGRSFNTLLQLTPGVAIAPSNGFTSPGQFSVSGQRTDANNFTVDGVSANFGVVAGFGAGASGAGTIPAFSALGGTSSLVSVDALQEFRIETSSFAPEFGRNPGGQVILSTRAGTNQFHGGIFDYFRNTFFDANNWFNDAASPAIPKSLEHHNDFGGFLGGPVLKDKTFFFFSYEGARLLQPQTQSVPVPSEYARTNAPTDLAPYITAFPEPDATSVVPGVYTSPSTQSYSNPATLNAFSMRIDHTINRKFSLFGRYNDAPSRIGSGGFDTVAESVDTKTLTAGLNSVLSDTLENSIRGNYSTQTASESYSLAAVDGAVVPNSQLYLGSLSQANEFNFNLGAGIFLVGGPVGKNRTEQMNFVDDLEVTLGKHGLKLGTDYRSIFLDVNPTPHIIAYTTPSVQTFLTSANSVSLTTSTQLPAHLLTQALSLYAQDSWKTTRNLVITYGLRWELSPAPSARGTTQLASWMNVDSPPQIALAPPGTPLWRTTYTNFAPRLGLAYSLTKNRDLVLRAGGGVFYDLGLGEVTLLPSYFPNSAEASYSSVAVPLFNISSYLVSPSRQPPYGLTYAFPPDLVLPRSYQWNVAIEKAFGDQQALTFTYVGQAGRDLLREEAFYQPNANFSSEFLLNKNDAFSNYDALQGQYHLRLSGGLEGLFNYCWAHSLDNASNDVDAALPSNIISAARDYAASDFDVRQSFSAAVTYTLPALASRATHVLTQGWSLNSIVVVRTGFPFNAILLFLSPDQGGYANTRPDLVPGQPFYIAAENAPGGKSVNPNAFLIPPTVRQGTEGRNDVPGFGLTQVDLSASRKFPLTDGVSLDFRMDAFNALNHPNFVNPRAFPQYDLWTSYETLNQSLGGLNPLFQEGGPRSLQISLKLTF
jgi:hypothetical protein